MGPPTMPFTALIEATRTGSLQAIDTLICQGAHLNIGNTDGDTPLAYSVYRGYMYVTHELLRNGADVNSHNAFYRRPAHWAAFQDFATITEILASYGANIDAQDSNGDSPYRYALHGNKARHILDTIHKARRHPHLLEQLSASIEICLGQAYYNHARTMMDRDEQYTQRGVDHALMLRARISDHDTHAHNLDTRISTYGTQICKAHNNTQKKRLEASIDRYIHNRECCFPWPLIHYLRTHQLHIWNAAPKTLYAPRLSRHGAMIAWDMLQQKPSQASCVRLICNELPEYTTYIADTYAQHQYFYIDAYDAVRQYRRAAKIIAEHCIPHAGTMTHTPARTAHKAGNSHFKHVFTRTIAQAATVSHDRELFQSLCPDEKIDDVLAQDVTHTSHNPIMPREITQHIISFVPDD